MWVSGLGVPVPFSRPPRLSPSVSPPPRRGAVPALPCSERSGGAALASLTGAPAAAGCLRLGAPSLLPDLFVSCPGQRGHSQAASPLAAPRKVTGTGGRPCPVPGTGARRLGLWILPGQPGWYPGGASLGLRGPAASLPCRGLCREPSRGAAGRAQPLARRASD